MRAASEVLLADGTIAVIRPLLATDRPAVEALHDGVSDASFRLRFFSSGRTAGRWYVEHLFSDAGAEIALVALVRDQIVALATAERLEDAAEVAFLVDDAHRGHGVGILLLEHLAAAGRDRGMTRFTAEVLGENVAMLRVFTAAGFHLGRTTSQGVTDVEMSTTASARAVAAADARESSSEARSLAALAAPQVVAVVGASRHGDGIGSAVLASIVEGGFTGQVVAIHPSGVVLAGVPTYPRLVDVPGHLDLVVIVVPAAGVLAVLEDAVTAGASTVVVISSGFEEIGPAGARLQHQLVRHARAHSVRLIGPNCLGVLVNDPQVRLNATFTSLIPPPGGLAVASQSGGVGIVLLDVALRLGLGVHSFVSLGNKADVSGNDLLSAWMHDPGVTGAALYLESLGNAPKFARLARRFARVKPVLVVLGGSSTGGRRAGVSHTAAASGPSALSARTVEALVEHSGVIACHSAEELAETALVLAGQPLPAGRRIAVLSNAGGMGVLAADAADRAGLVVPELSPGLQRRLQAASPALAGAGNPVDLGAGATSSLVKTAVTEVLASGEVDALLVVLVATRVGDPAPLEQALGEARGTAPQLPVLLVSIGAPVARRAPAGLTELPTMHAAIEALARVCRYAEWLAVPPVEPVAPDEARAHAANALTHDLADGWLTGGAAVALLGPYGLVPREASTGPGTAGPGQAVELRLVEDAALGATLSLVNGQVDPVLLLLPLDPAAVERALGALANDSARELPVDVGGLQQLVQGAGQLVTEVARVVGLELQAHLGEVGEADRVDEVSAVGAVDVLDVRVRLGPPAHADAGVPRSLRVPH
ncbi:MAG: GNAT family N-acetyltransferase [Nocardioides sp.]|nr:GNAT family N-acetyltransferase [Nocardioides sp.]